MTTIAGRTDRTAATVAAELVEALDAIPATTICRARIGAGERCGIALRRTREGWYGHARRPIAHHYPVPAEISESELREMWGGR